MQPGSHWVELEMQMAAVEAEMRCRGRENVRASTARVKPPKFDGYISWTLLLYGFEAVIYNNNWTCTC
jgi:hypothetical protein